MLKRSSLRLFGLSGILVWSGVMCLSAGVLARPAVSQDSPRDSSSRGRKYTPPPDTAKISVKVMKETNGKPVEHAAVIFHILQGSEKNKGNMELKTNDEGTALIDVIPIGVTVRLQVIASGFQTFGDDYKIDAGTKEIVVKLKRPARQYSTYEHADAGAAPAADSAGKTDSPAPPK
ncbi:MAG TPA: hypothetical protein VGD59_07450 [Acidisarcina sp.]